ncbi:tRNA (mnm(5)s(2)U34)-methyltransferase [Acetivibrio cellulolyticus]|uniref:tRNA (mnm(5)s(2)U34)-methyltransferase n=1 Tax=Acetivibrio cellulolyticus TaxID=35830 RepID=UPI0001E2F13A|nr:class I SAM-dependent methyltransferase [Acetivibrio cellulolyticus]
MPKIGNSLTQSHKYIEHFVEEGDTVIDATAGNGSDTVFLAKLVGESGHVYSFDVQQIALDRTAEKLDSLDLRDRVDLINDGHENLDNYVKSKVKAVMFNLGYLPRGDHNIGTRAKTTITAIQKSMELLVVGGIISIVVYHGGDSGFDEKIQVIEYLGKLEPKKYVVMKTEFINQENCPPILVCIEKISE